MTGEVWQGHLRNLYSNIMIPLSNNLSYGPEFFLLTGHHESYLSVVHPWYYDNLRLWIAMSDFWLSLVGPVVAYWLLSGLFETLDMGDWE